MRTTIHCLALLLVTPSLAQYNTENLRISATAAMSRQPVLERLALYPVMANGTFLAAHASVEKTTPMKSAIADKKLRITEQEHGAQVNKLIAENTSKETLYLMQGEVVAGGKQDRVLAQDLLLAPGQRMEVAAYCVEQGRWESGAERREFSKTTGVGAQKIRSAVANKKEQQAVWQDVAGYLDAKSVNAPTGTFNALQEDKEFQQDMARYRRHFDGLYQDHPQVVGVVAVSGDQVIGCDIFATHALFRDAYDGLLTAYITEAITRGAPVKAGHQEAQSFLDDLLGDERRLEDRMRTRGSLFRDKDRTLRVSWF
ncbi:MAG: hypothetical protein KIT10_04990 [Flavobacteriales bacterium]|nr:hypothetical protein [Flavobacteriales bacterium]